MKDQVLKAFLGLIQGSLFVFGVVQLFSGNWWVLILCCALALVVGLLGARFTRLPGGNSVLAESALNMITTASKRLDAGDVQGADEYLTRAFRDFRMGNDFGHLTVFLPLGAIVKIGVSDVVSALRYLDEADRVRAKVPSHASSYVTQLSDLNHEIRQEIKTGHPNVGRLLDSYMAMND